MNCLIVDDDEMARASLENLCKKIDGIVPACAEDALTAMRMMQASKYELVFLDVEMPEMTGLELLEASDELPAVIIISANREYAFEAFSFDVLDYLEKPVALPRLIKAINKVKRTTTPIEVPAEKSDDSIYVKVSGKLVKLTYDEIYVIESMRDYVKFITKDGRHVVHSTLKGIEDKLSAEPRFFKTHRSFIINTDHIADVDEKSVVVGKSVVPISRSMRPAFMEKLNLL
ncbi:LytR/AlgR family response regulator transcription factor [Sanyastnella coralliicola]|uniref:LytR/AlgR family response regulator transcription factor n=1 Tax=Sanyastnella coralliicola TaxID=3069118 RepID=UPI0027BA0268|nr:LytTR family DNA-binding domain-containing protein [Longitalea sp. SCSIO 12813]